MKICEECNNCCDKELCGSISCDVCGKIIYYKAPSTKTKYAMIATMAEHHRHGGKMTCPECGE